MMCFINREGETRTLSPHHDDDDGIKPSNEINETNCINIIFDNE